MMEGVIYVLFLYFAIYAGAPLLMGYGFFVLFKQLSSGWHLAFLLSGFFISLLLIAGWSSSQKETQKEFGNDPLVPWDNFYFPMVLFFCIGIITLAGIPRTGTEGIIWCAGFSWGYLLWQVLWQEISLRGSVGLGFESFLVFLIWINYLFKQDSAREAIMKRKQNQQRKNKERELEAKRKEFDKKEQKLQKRIRGLELEIPETILPEGGVRYKGYLDQVKQRFRETQMTRTLKIRRGRLEEARRVHQEGTALLKARENFERTFLEFQRRNQTFEIEEKEAQARYERVDLENELKLLKLQIKKAEKEVELEEKTKKLKKLRESEQKEEPSPEQRELQRTEDKIKTLKAKGASLGMAVKARDEELKKFDSEKNKELYQMAKNMWNNFIMDILE